MEYRTRVTLDVAAEQAWATLSAIRAWPSWTPTVQALDSDDDEPTVGRQVSIKQPGRRTVRYTVDLVDPGRRFRWGSRGWGVTQSADHVVAAVGERACTVEVAFAMTGPVGAVLGRLGAGKIRGMVDTEAASLRRHLTSS